MKLHLCAIGRLRKGPEKALIDDYLDRAGKTGRALGLGPCAVSDAEAKRGGGMAEEGELLSRMIPDGAKLVCLDERGKLLTSPQLADQLAAWRDEGIRDAAFVIGGADGIDPALRDRADLSISFGKMVWPHMLARVMLSEQLYRATTILAGSPYHRV